MEFLKPLAILLAVLAVLAWIGCIGLTVWLDHQLKGIDATLDRCRDNLLECRVTLAHTTGYQEASLKGSAADLEAAKADLDATAIAMAHQKAAIDKMTADLKATADNIEAMTADLKGEKP